MVKASEIEAVRERLADPGKWCQKRAVRWEKKDGQLVEQACLSQAVCGLSSNETKEWLSERCRDRGFGGMADLNDKNDHAYVLEFLDECLVGLNAA